MPSERDTFNTAWAEFAGSGTPPAMPDAILAETHDVEGLAALLKTCLATEVQGWFPKPTVTRAGATASGVFDDTISFFSRPLGWWATLTEVLAEQGWEELGIEPGTYDVDAWNVVVTRAATPAEIAEMDRELAEAVAAAKAIEEARDRALYEQLKARFDPPPSE